jgi:hypothetical protein
MIVIPMAGASRRFADAGYLEPKHQLPLGGISVFDHAVGSFQAYFVSLPFLFVVRAEAAAFVGAACERLGIREARVVTLDAPTAGQAETVELGLSGANVGDAQAITIFNIDTFRPSFTFPNADWAKHSDGWLEVFRGSGANWSYVRPAPRDEPRALETAEKRPISDLCCTGLYHFRCAGDFRQALARERAAPSAPELYVAPLYNHLINEGRRIHYRLIAPNEVTFCGVPAEYEALKAALP